ncbi:TPA: CDP-diacylglycerol--serine O-phosphatidyltransferase [Candidatus Sumerlaeota bacterium]|jgi:CDP-diacylglycerol---serine O-phosphatidyltransferase|nr:CDP-diacylglycerol--serine O-phosphatidyltransferase [Candidatus Sumerlaeota bacterium]
MHNPAPKAQFTTTPSVNGQAHKPRLRLVYVWPNLFTAANMFMGLLAIYWVIDEAQGLLQDRLEWACWFILIGGFFDMFDGAIARLTHTQSEFGVQFDSLSDLVTFGVAPSVAAFYLMQGMGIEHRRVVICICALFCICSALRLARYNVQVKGPERRGFIGLPTPGAALAITFLVLLIRRYDLNMSETVLFSLGESKLLLKNLVVFFMPVVVLGIALLMVSEVPYPKLSEHLRIKRRMSFDTLVYLIVFVLILMALKSELRVVTAFLMIYAYILYGLTVYLMQLAKARREKALLPHA